MSIETGGRSDKSGNIYENDILADKLIELFLERATSIEVEPLGDEGAGVEFTVTQTNGDREYYQCKSSNGSVSHWRPYDLQTHSVFATAKKHIQREVGNTYHFVSPLPYNELDSLCERARMAEDLDTFVSNQLTNPALRNWWDNCKKYFGEDDKTIFCLLQQCYFELIPRNIDMTRKREQLLSLIFFEEKKESSAEMLLILKNIINEKKLWGRRLNVSDIAALMNEHGFKLMPWEMDSRYLPRVQEINKQYKDGYRPINHAVFPRVETEKILEKIQSGGSVLLLGKAGAGKSGCIQELIHKLDESNTLYLALPLDKYRPEHFSDEYGKTLGFPGSPILCMHKLSGGSPVVIIFDQLDSLRWMNGTVAAALDVCKQMIREADTLNRHSDGRISIVFACRKFDYETDPGIQGLFEKRDDGQLLWSKVEVGLLSNDAVSEIVGEPYKCMSAKLRTILKTPSSLYVWMGMENGNKNQISSLRQLLARWWLEIQDKCRNSGAIEGRICQCRDKIVSIMHRREQLSFPSVAVNDFGREVDMLTSFGVLTKSKGQLSFAHQSFFDYFSVENQIAEIYNDGKHLPELYPEMDAQTPDIRYQLLMLLQYLMEADAHTFLIEVRHVLQSENFHFYFQCCTFDVLGQIEDPDDAVWTLVGEYLSDEKWRTYLLRMVFFGHPAFIRLLLQREKNFAWWETEGVILLRSIMEKDADLALDIIEMCGEGRFEERELYNILSIAPESMPDRGFALRLKLAKQNPELLQDNFGLYREIKNGFSEAVNLLQITAEADKTIRDKIHLPDEKVLTVFSEKHAELVIEKLADVVFQKSKQERDQQRPWSRQWCWDDYPSGNNRNLVLLVQAALSKQAEDSPDQLLKFINRHREKTPLEPELFIHAVEKLPTSHADQAITWLLSAFNENAFERTSGEATELSACQRVLERFSPCCSEELFRQLEEHICRWSPPTEKMCRHMRYRLEDRKTGDWNHFTAFWGQLQFMLLPHLDQARVSSSTRELIDVLRRKFPFGVSEFDISHIGMAHFISSPVEGHTDRLSDKSWLRLVGNVSTNPQMRSFKNWDKGTESSPEMFARSFSSAAEKEPLRFAKLALSFPNNAYEGFCDGAVRACKSEEVPLELACQVIRKFCVEPSRNLAVSLSWTIQERASEKWPQDIVDMLIKISLSHPDPEQDSMPVQSMDKERNRVCDDLLQSSINCARGCALCTISVLIWEHPEESGMFVEVIRASTNDPHPAVLFAAVRCVYAYYNIDKALAKECLDRLLERDLRVLYTREAGNLLLRFYEDDIERYRGVLMTSVASSYIEVKKQSIMLIIALSVDDDWLLERMLSIPLDKEEMGAALSEAEWLIKSDNWKSLGKRIALHYLDIGANGKELTRLFSGRVLNIENDRDIIERLFHSEDDYISNRALDYICETGGCITGYINAVFKYIKVCLTQTTYFGELDKLIKFVARAFQQGRNDAAIRRECLNIWDELFRRFPLEMSSLSQSLEQ